MHEWWRRLHRSLRVFLEARVGTARGRRFRSEAMASVPSVPQAIEAIQGRWNPSADSSGETPIFIFASGWRSGSTLLQRLVVSGGDALIWGEPWAFCDHVRTLARTLRPLREQDPPEEFFFDHIQDHSRTRWQEEWIANLYPEPDALVAAHRQFFLTLYADPARRRGYRRWGIKEVRLGADEATYLRWLFPAAKLLFLYRNPYHAYRSYRLKRSWFDRWPEEPVLTPLQFGRMWKRLTEGFLERHEKLDGRLVQYEELCSGRLSAELSAYLDLPLREDALRKVILGRRRELEAVPAPERRLLRRAVEPLASRLGYEP